MNGQRVGYRRVSSTDQSTARQLDGEQLDRIFTDKLSGKDTNRPELDALRALYATGTRWSYIASTGSPATLTTSARSSAS